MGKYRRKMIAAGCVLAAFLMLGIFVLVWFFGARYPAFDERAKAEQEIPLEDGFCPQGLCALPENPKYEVAVSGYLKDAPSRVYLIGKETKSIILEEDGKPLTTHFGGITCTGNYLVVASGKSLVRFPVEEAINAKDGAAVKVTDSFQTGLQNAYCYYFDNVLYAGEFYREQNYPTDQSHHIEKDGETNYAFVYAFEADENCEGGVKNSDPILTISVPALVQGIAIYEGGIALSTSYGLPNSHIYFYERKEGDVENNMLRLDSSDLKDDLVAPCMSEEIYEEDGRLYILFESKAEKYRQFVRRQVDTVYSVPLA